MAGTGVVAQGPGAAEQQQAEQGGQRRAPRAAPMLIRLGTLATKRRNRVASSSLAPAGRVLAPGGIIGFPVACIEQAVEPLRVVGADDAPCLPQQVVVERQGKVRDPLVGRRMAVEGVFQAARAVLFVQFQGVPAQMVGQRMHQVARLRAGQQAFDQSCQGAGA